MRWNGVCEERLYSLVRFGNKNSGGWDECECGIPDEAGGCCLPGHWQVEQLLQDAALGKAVREVIERDDIVVNLRAENHALREQLVKLQEELNNVRI